MINDQIQKDIEWEYKELIYKYCRKLKFTFSFQAKCCEILKKCLKNNSFSYGIKSHKVIAIIYVSCLLNGHRITQEKICDKLGSTPNTLQRWYNKILEETNLEKYIKTSGSDGYNKIIVLREDLCLI